MRMHQLLVCAAWLVFAAAWFLPVITHGVTLPERLPGWQATRVALCGVWPCLDVTIEWYQTVLFTVSALTTLLFLWWISFLLMALGLFDLSRRGTLNRKMSATTHLCACVL